MTLFVTLSQNCWLLFPRHLVFLQSPPSEIGHAIGKNREVDSVSLVEADLQIGSHDPFCQHEFWSHMSAVWTQWCIFNQGQPESRDGL